MGIAFTCPECGKSYELDPVLAGKSFACECGAVTDVPAASTVPKTCPKCHAEVPEGNILCTACGTNLKTGRSVAEEQDDANEFTFGARYGRLTVKLAVLLFVLALGALAYRQFTRKPYGVASSHPLGTPAALEAHFTRMGMALERDEQGEGAASGIRLRKFVDETTEAESRGALMEYVYLATDEAGHIRALGGVFHTLDPAIPSPQPRVTQFLRQYLETIGWTEPRFERESAPGGLLPTSRDVAQIETAGFRGKWIQAAGSALIASYEEVVVVRPEDPLTLFEGLGLAP